MSKTIFVVFRTLAAGAVQTLAAGAVRTLAAGAGITLAAGAAFAQVPQTLDCLGPFAKTANEAALVKAFGRANVRSAEIPGAEGSSEPGTLVFPDDPKRRIEILWHDSAKKARPAAISVRAPSTWTVHPSPKTPRTIALATSVDDVEEANERPFTVTGFGWDMGGYAAGWHGGKLSTLDGGCTLSLRFDPDAKAKPAALKKASGDRQFSSSDAAIKAVKPRVSEISIGWGED